VPPMPKNIVVCCDGTGNEIGINLTNVLKLFRITEHSERQRVYYDPGVGTLGESDAWSRLKSNAKGVFGLVTGYGLDDNILGAYQFIVRNYEDGDDIYLFGFSRGAYTVRVVAGFLHLVGLVHPDQSNIAGYALAAYKRVGEQGDFNIAWNFQRVGKARRVPIKFVGVFVGVWDTVASVIVPRPDRFYVPSLLTLPYTRTNSSVEVFRQAIAIDERRRMFRLNEWEEPQKYEPRPFAPSDSPKLQDIKQVWFSGVHADVGGGYPEVESGLSKFPLDWMVEEAKRAGLRINTAMRNHLVRGQERKGGRNTYVPPDPNGCLHDSMTVGWRPLEWLPKSASLKESPDRQAFAGLYLPRGEPRVIPDGARIHHSVIARRKSDEKYRPPNFPSTLPHVVEGPHEESAN
jgi:uncharacterized protein (DUF2235 family)